MSHAIEIVSHSRKYPFSNMKIDDNSFLGEIDGRQTCVLCGKSRKFYCYSCHIPIENLKMKLPKLELPIQIDIIKHRHEIDGKSTAVHGAVLSPANIKIWQYPDIPDYSKETGVVLLFPCKNSSTIRQLFDDKIKLKEELNFGMPKGFNMGTLLRVRVKEERPISTENNFNSEIYSWDNLPIRKAVLIDSTWNQSRGIYKDERISSIKTVILQNRLSQFWRHQKKSPRWFLSTIEAIHQFLLEVHVQAWGLNANYRGLDSLELDDIFFKNINIIENFNKNNINGKMDPYNGQYDNLLFFFSYMYDLIHSYYDHNQLKSYKRPI